MTRRLLPVGERAILVELDDLDAVLALAARLIAELTPAATDPAATAAADVDIVPAARTVLVAVETPAALARIVALIDSLPDHLPLRQSDALAPPAEQVVEIGVRYDGADLAEVAALTGLSPAEVIAAHTGRPWRFAFGGFAPGFAYLTGGDPRLAVPRRPTPRTRVPRGAVALAAGFSACYPQSSPGGWHLIGTTDSALWDAERDPPALLGPGCLVQFVAQPPDVVRPHVDPPGEAEVKGHGGAISRQPPGIGAGNGRLGDTRRGLAADAHRRSDAARGPTSQIAESSGVPVPGAIGSSDEPGLHSGLEVLDPGVLTLVVDRGRPGHAVSGVGPSGPADRAAFALGARLLGQGTDRAGLECLLGRVVLRAGGPLQVALTGAAAPAWVDGEPVAFGEVVALPAGAVLRFGGSEAGLRSYVSVRGGLAVRPVLGSRCTDTLSEIGPAPLRAGDLLPVGEPLRRAGQDRRAEPAALRPGRVWVPPAPAGAVVLDGWPGPRLDWLADPYALTTTAWIVSQRSDRVGIRLAGTPLRRAPARTGAELPSEGLVRGAVQIPSSGEPVIFGADHPVTGGYPVAAVLTERSCDAAAQLRPGQPVTLRLIPYPAAPAGN